ncbi:MAG: response regulator transcription factor [Chloroflexota bacterium]
MTKKVLIIDDDPEVGKIVKAILKPLDLTLYQAFSGPEGLKLAYEIHPDLVILDVMMPNMDGFDVCARLREMSTVPILMLTARSNEKDIVQGFNVGVDDFVKKPFNKNEFEARVRALLRRSKTSSASESSYITQYADPALEIDLEKQVVKVHGEVVDLSPREFSLLACLVRDQGRIVSHRDLIREIWGEQYTMDSSLSSLYIYYLRKKLKDGKNGHQYIKTLWGRGYWFEPRPEE